MDKEIIFFIIFVVFSILSSLLNRKKKKSGQPPITGEGRPRESAPKKKPFSFEDILREFEAEVMEKQQPKPEREIVTAEEEDDEYEYQNEPQKTYSRSVEEGQDKSSVYESYEGTSYESLDEEIGKVAERNEMLSKEAEGKRKKAALSEYANTLQDPEGIRKAFVMKEILDRKYF